MEWTKDKFYRMYEEYNGMVYRLCMLYLKNESDAGDAVQDIFLKMYREVLYFYYYEEYSVKEISAMTGIKESTIQSRLSAARKQLKMMLETRKEEEI